MANEVRHYDTGAMKSAASEIRSKITTYKKANSEIETTITGLKNYFDNAVSADYISRYERDLKKTAESVQELMEQYAKFLDASADAVDKMIKEGQAGING